jgi:hypothetical protein
LSDSYASPETKIDDSITKEAKSSFQDSLNKALEDLFNGNDIDGDILTKLITHIEKEHGLNLGKMFGNIRYDMVETFYEGLYKWMFEHRKDYTSIAVYSELTQITNGVFPLRVKYHEMEMNIIKRSVVMDFLNQTFLAENSFNAIDKMAKLFKVDIDSRFLKMYFTPVYEMLEFTMYQEIAFYKALANELNLDVKLDVISGQGSLNKLFGQPRKDEIFKKSLSPSFKESIAHYLREEMEQYDKKQS